LGKHMQRVTAHLAVAEDLMLLGSISSATNTLAQASNARTNVVIGPISSGYEPGLAQQMSPLSLGSVFGDPTASPLSSQAFFSSLSSNSTLPYELMGVSITIGGKAVPLAFVSPGRVSFFVPSDVGLGTAEVIVISQDGYVSLGTTTIAPNIFRIMTAGANGTGGAVVMNSQRQSSGDFDVTTQENLGSDKRTRLSIFATGLSGSASNSNLSNDLTIYGLTRPNLAESVVVEARTSSGRIVRLPVEFAGAEGMLPGLDQVNVVLLPELRGAGTVELTLIVGAVRSNAPRIRIR
jgi:uncharacterized protein (TIGR03437 family)